MKELANQWMELARQDLLMAELALEAGIYNQVCFHSQQCVEKCIKGLLSALNLTTPRTHSVVDLLSLLDSRYYAGIRQELSMLDAFYTSTRYPDSLPGGLENGLPVLADAEHALGLARACRDETLGDKAFSGSE